MTADLVTGRSVPRWRGEPVTHDVQFRPAAPGIPGFRPGAEVAMCPCGWLRVIDGGHTEADKTRLRRQHAGLEDET